MKKLVTVCAMLLSLASCVSMGTMVDLDKIQDFKKGVTTEAEVVAKLGPPNTVSTYGDIKSIAYSGVETHSTGLVSSAGKSVYVMFQFQNDKLLSVTSSSSNIKTN